MNDTPTPRTDARKASFALDTIRQLESELAAVTDQRDRLAEACSPSFDTTETDAAWSAHCIDPDSASGDPWDLAKKLETELKAVTEQRDRLAEALQKLNEYDLGDIPVGVVRRCKEALQFLNPDHTVDSNDMTAAVKGGADE